MLVEVGLVVTAARPQLAPRDVAEHHRHGQAGAPAEPLEHDPLGLVEVGIVDDADVGAAVDQQLLERVVVAEPVDLVARVADLALDEHAGVDQGAQHLGLRLPAGDRDRRGAERVQRLLGGAVEELVERVRAGHGGRQRHQHAQLAAQPLKRVLGARSVPGEREHGRRAGLRRRVERRQQRRHDPRVELGAGAALELDARLGDRERSAVGTIGDERVPGVAGQHDPRGERDRLAREAVGVAAAVPALVRVAHGGGDRLEARQRAQDPLAGHRVLVHQRPLGLVEPAGLVQHAVGDAELPDAVQQRRRLDVRDLPGVEPQPARHGDGERLDGVGVLAGVAVARRQRERQRADHRVVGLRDALVLGLEGLERDDQRQLPTAQADGGRRRLATQVLQPPCTRTHGPVIGAQGAALDLCLR